LQDPAASGGVFFGTLLPFPLFTKSLTLTSQGRTTQCLKYYNYLKIFKFKLMINRLHCFCLNMVPSNLSSLAERRDSRFSRLIVGRKKAMGFRKKKPG